MTYSTNTLIEQMIKSDLAKPEEILGCSDLEIAEIEQKTKLNLPRTYKEFLRTMGKCAGWLLEGSDFFYPEMLDCQALAERVLTRDNKPFTLPESCFVFIQHQGYQFMYFDTASKSDDPAVFHYIEGSGKASKVADSFSQWLATTITNESELNARVKDSRP